MSPSPLRVVVDLLAGCLAMCLLASGCSEIQDVSHSLSATFLPKPAPEPVAAQPVASSSQLLLQPLAPVRRDIFTRSYRLGETYSIHTGAPVVSIKNYSITEKVGKATALRDFAQLCRRRMFAPRKGSPCTDPPLSSVHGSMGSVFEVIAAATFPEAKYFAVRMTPDNQSEVVLLVDTSGRLRPGEYVAWRDDLSAGVALGRVPLDLLSPELQMNVSTPLFSFESVERFVYMGPGYLSFDLIFTGTRDTPRGELMTFTYREYGRDSSDRAAFERTLQFPTSDPVIEVQDLRIEVEPLGYNDLKFRVIADGQPAARRVESRGPRQ